MTQQRAAEIQGLLEGIALPASKNEVVSYAREQDATAARELSELPDKQYRSIDEVGEALSPVQPVKAESAGPLPHEESDLPPGGDSYTDPNAHSGAVRHDAPPYNPPQKALEQQTKVQNKQKERQQKAELG